MLVVIVIIGILISFTTLAIRGADPEELIKEEAQRFDQLMQLALQEAVFKGLDYGIAFTPGSYAFVLKDDQGEWQPLADRLLHKRELEHDIEIELVFEHGQQAQATSSSKDKLVPQVLLYSSDEIDPEFSAYFTIPGVKQSYQVNASSDGQHEVKKSE